MPGSARRTVAPAPGWEAVVDSIGPKVHALRRERGLTLAQLAHLADVSTATVHKVERGDMVPTVTTLLKLAAALGSSVRHFVEPAGSTAVHTRFSGLDAASLTGRDPGSRLRGATVRLAPGDDLTTALHSLSDNGFDAGAGEALLLVLSGAVEVEASGERYTVAAGESLHRTVGGTVVNRGEVPAEVVWVTAADRSAG